MQESYFLTYATWCTTSSGHEIVGAKAGIMSTVFPQIVSAETILFRMLGCDNYSREETISFLSKKHQGFITNIKTVPVIFVVNTALY